MSTSDIVVVGGGLVGSALAWGLAQQGCSVNVLDEGDLAFRASRGNFGLVWVQGKGYGCSDYARWSMASAALWPGFAQTLRDTTGTDVKLEQKGGLSLSVTEDDLDAKVQRLQWLRDEVGEDYHFDVLDAAALKKMAPEVGPTIPGAVYTRMDGHVNPLKLLLALHQGLKEQGVSLHSGAGVKTITHNGGLYECHTAKGVFKAPRIVLAAGLANTGLAKQVGIHVPIVPNRGQVLITERLPRFLDLPTNYVRQTDEGTIQIGDSIEDVGYNDQIATPVLQNIAERAVRCFPILERARIVRSWAALRIMSPDGFPVYQESERYPGAFVATCHSGVTLAANHALTIAPWMAGGPRPDAITEFGAGRFTQTGADLSGEERAQ